MIEGLRKISDDFHAEPIKQTVTILNSVDQCSDSWDTAIEDLAMYILQQNKFDQLQQLVINGPVFDGDVISKSDRNFLIDIGLADRVMHKGEWGYTTATYRGGFVMKACFVSKEAYDNYVKSRLL